MSSVSQIQQIDFIDQDRIQVVYELNSMWALGYFHSIVDACGGTPSFSTGKFRELASNQKILTFPDSGSYEVVNKYLNEVPEFSIYNLLDGNLEKESESIDSQIRTLGQVQIRTLGQVLNAASTSYFYHRNSQTVIVKVQDEFDIGYIDGILKMRTLDNPKKLKKFSEDNVSYIMIEEISGLETLRKLEQIPKTHAKHQEDILKFYTTLFQ